MKFQDKATGSLTLGLLALALGGCTALDAMRGGADEGTMAGDRAMTAQARLVSTAGRLAGTARFEQAPTGVLIRITARGLPPGPHGLHLHETGACTPDFGAAGGHVNPDGAMHGLKHPDGPDPGDLPNLIVGGDGRADAELFTTLVSIDGGPQPALLDADGTAIIVHAEPDDHETQPIGGAGERIACGIVRP